MPSKQFNYLGVFLKLKRHLTKYKVSLSQNKVNLDTTLKQTWIQQWTKEKKKNLISGQKRNDSHK